MKPLFSILITGALIIALTTCAFAGVPHMINYQGKLTDANGNLIPGTVTKSVTFTIYDDSIGGNILWIDTLSVQLTHGVFSVLLGEEKPIPNPVFNGGLRYLGVKVGTDPEMSPRKKIGSVAYAFRSEWADTTLNADMVDGLHASSTPTANYLFPLDANTKIPNARLYTGSGNGLDADKVDGKHGTNLVRGVGTTNYIPKWVGSDTLDNSLIYQTTGGNIGIGTTNPGAKLDVQTGSGTAVSGESHGGSGMKYGGEFSALDNGTYNIGLVTMGGCSGMGCTPGSQANIGIWAYNTFGPVPSVPSGNWAGYFSGNVRINGDLQLKGSVKFEYDSTFSMSLGETKTLTHGLGGDSTKYIVLMYGISSSGGVHQANYGTCAFWTGLQNKWLGCEWDQLTSTTIRVTRAANDDQTVASKQWNQVHLRILKNQ